VKFSLETTSGGSYIEPPSAHTSSSMIQHAHLGLDSEWYVIGGIGLDNGGHRRE
jgi:hypothetical protein